MFLLTQQNYPEMFRLLVFESDDAPSSCQRKQTVMWFPPLFLGWISTWEEWHVYFLPWRWKRLEYTFKRSNEWIIVLETDLFGWQAFKGFFCFLFRDEKLPFIHSNFGTLLSSEDGLFPCLSSCRVTKDGKGKDFESIAWKMPHYYCVLSLKILFLYNFWENTAFMTIIIMSTRLLYEIMFLKQGSFIHSWICLREAG